MNLNTRKLRRAALLGLLWIPCSSAVMLLLSGGKRQSDWCLSMPHPSGAQTTGGFLIASGPPYILKCEWMSSTGAAFSTLHSLWLQTVAIWLNWALAVTVPLLLFWSFAISARRIDGETKSRI
jgi:hypothetical protein